MRSGLPQQQVFLHAIMPLRNTGMSATQCYAEAAQASVPLSWKRKVLRPAFFAR